MGNLGIKDIGVYIPPTRTDNIEKLKKFDFKPTFLDEKIGVYKTSVKDEGEGNNCRHSEFGYKNAPCGGLHSRQARIETELRFF